MTYANLPLTAKRALVGTHVNELKVKTARAIVKTHLRRDRTHLRISQAAAYLVEQDRGHLRYGGMYGDGSTVRTEGSVSEIVKPESARWIEQAVAA